MATILVKQLGSSTPVGTSYVQIGSDIATDKLQATFFHICNLLNQVVKFRAYVADGSYSGSAEPTGGTLVAQIAYDLPIMPNDVVQIPGVVFKEGQAIVVRADTASALSVILCGTEHNEDGS